MKKSDLRILVIEDDPSLGKAIEEGLKRSGYKVDLATHAAQAKSACGMTDFDGIVADCMLPQKNGVDLIADIVSDSMKTPAVVLISGIYKDRSFAQDAIRRTRALAFLNKPFDLNALITTFDQAFSSVVEHSREPLFDLLSKQQFSTRDKLSALASTEYVHGFDLPFIYHLLLDPQIEGDLHIQYEDRQNPSVVSFANGSITKVLHEDSQSYFGVLLLEKGFITATELEEALKKQNQKPIGEHLIAASQLSPHAIDIVMHEQMMIRISKTIQDTSVQVRFIQQDVDKKMSKIDGLLFTQLLSDWISSKISSNWLRAFYTPWLENPIMSGQGSSKLNLLKSFSITHPFLQLFGNNEWPHKLQDIVAHASENEDEVLRGLHFLLLQGVVFFGEKAPGIENFEIKIARANKIYDNIKSKDHYEILGVSHNARHSEIHRAYHELAKNFHPDKIHPQSPNEYRELTQKIFTLISEAYQILNSESKRRQYDKSLELGRAEEVLLAESQFEEALRHLKSNRHREARKILEIVMMKRGARSDVMVYYIWALIKEKRRKMDPEELAKKIGHYLNKVAHEDRHSPQYFFIKGMYHELIGQVQRAYQLLKHSASLDPNFIEPKREMSYIKQNYGSQRQNAFTDEISVVVTKFFKKKSG